MGVLKLEDVHYTYDDYKLWEVLGEVDYKISDDTVLRPDVVLTCGETNEMYLVKAPEIIVEIISPSTAHREKVNRIAREATLGYEKYKFEIYEKEKVKYYIIIYPEELSAKVFKLDGKEYDKQGDFTDESYAFDATTCSVSIDFERVFRRFRK